VIDDPEKAKELLSSIRINSRFWALRIFAWLLQLSAAGLLLFGLWLTYMFANRPALITETALLGTCISLMCFPVSAIAQLILLAINAESSLYRISKRKPRRK